MSPVATATTAGSPRRWSVRRLVILAVPAAAVAAVILVAASVRGWVEEASTPGLSPAAFTEATGIEIVRVTVTASGGALDVRYRVTDASTASAHAAGGHTVVAVQPGSGELLDAMFGMHARTPKFENGHTYYQLLVNSGGAVEPGDHVSVVVHAARLSDVVVQ